MALIKLPNEIIALLVETIQANNGVDWRLDLRQLCVSHSRFQVHVQKLLFQNILLRFCSFYNKIHTFHELIQDNPRLISYVQNLSVRDLREDWETKDN
jgi:hypothetical protein